MTATRAMHGRGKAGYVHEPAVTRSTLERARCLFADLSEALEAEIGRLRSLEDHSRPSGRAREVTDLVRENQKILGTVLDIEARLDARTGPAPAHDMIDLEEARAEIARRLARLSA